MFLFMLEIFASDNSGSCTDLQLYVNGTYSIFPLDQPYKNSQFKVLKKKNKKNTMYLHTIVNNEPSS